MNTDRIQELGNEVARQVETINPSLLIEFLAHEKTDDKRTFIEIYLSPKTAGEKKWYPIGLIAYEDTRLTERGITAYLQKEIEERIRLFQLFL
jgi:hypothetical protein